MNPRTIDTNSQALRWCKRRKATIEYEDWKALLKLLGIPEGIACRVQDKKIGTAYGKTLLDCVNELINKNEKVVTL